MKVYFRSQTVKSILAGEKNVNNARFVIFVNEIVFLATTDKDLLDKPNKKKLTKAN